MRAIPAILQSAKTIAVVGISPTPSRTSYAISRYLIEEGFTVVPVNPHCEQVHDLDCYPDLASIPAEVTIDIVNIFRRPKYTAGVVQDALERAKRTGETPAIWTQIGVSSQEAQRLAEEAGLDYVANRCIMVENERVKR